MSETLKPQLKRYRIGIPAYIDDVSTSPELLELREVGRAFGVPAGQPVHRLYLHIDAHSENEAEAMASYALATALIHCSPIKPTDGSAMGSIHPAIWPQAPEAPDEGEKEP